MDRPFARSYWVQPGELLAGYFPGSQDPGTARANLCAMLDLGIRTFVNLMGENDLNYDGEPFAPYDATLQNLALERGIEATHLRLPIRDLGLPSIQLMRQILDAINASIKSGKPVYVHCWGGLGRTGTVVGCWLLDSGIAEASNVIRMIRQLRKNDPRKDARSPETADQTAFVLQWAEHARRDI